jgi:hypothetical protein
VAKEKGIFGPAIAGENPTALRQVDAVPVQQSPAKASVKAKQASPPAQMHIPGEFPVFGGRYRQVWLGDEGRGMELSSSTLPKSPSTMATTHTSVTRAATFV